MTTAAVFLVLNGALVLLLAQLTGVPYGRALNRGAGEDRVRAWRVAHAALAIGAILLLALAGVLRLLPLTPTLAAVLSGAFVVSAYGFAFALIVGAWHNVRGLHRGGNAINRAVYTGNMIGVAGGLIGTILLIISAYRALL